jgi:RRXRR protein
MYKQQFVPVFDLQNRSLMPTKPQRADRWVKSGKATPFWKKGIWCIRLNFEPSARNLQPVCIGVDPGSKREGFTVKSQAHTYLNIQSHAVDWVSEAEEVSTNMRRARRFRNTPCRSPKKNFDRGEFLPPSTRARWQAKLRIIKFLMQLYPVTHIGVEDIKATTWKGAKRYNTSFSPLQVGKDWFYGECRKLAILEMFDGYEDTYQTRQQLGLKKLKNKTSSDFNAHCVDSWVIAYLVMGGDAEPDNRNVIEFIPLRFHRRQLHRLEHAPRHIRTPYGGTVSMGFKRGGIAKHPKYGKVYIGGSSKGRVSLHSIETGKRLCQNAKPEDIKFLSYNSWRWQYA